jgi:hypothetical protein
MERLDGLPHTAEPELHMTKVAGVSKGREMMRVWIAEDPERAREYVRARTVVCPETACWLWQRALFKKTGYGVAGVSNRGTWRAHALAYESFVKLVPDGLILRHDCDNPRCANPAHLRVGTNADNSRDMVERGRAPTGAKNGAHTKPERRASGDRNGSRTKPESRPRGERHWKAKLTAADALRAVEMRAQGATLCAIGEELGVVHGAVSRILVGKTWSHVTGINRVESATKES